MTAPAQVMCAFCFAGTVSLLCYGNVDVIVCNTAVLVMYNDHIGNSEMQLLSQCQLVSELI